MLSSSDDWHMRVFLAYLMNQRSVEGPFAGEHARESQQVCIFGNSIQDFLECCSLAPIVFSSVPIPGTVQAHADGIDGRDSVALVAQIGCQEGKGQGWSGVVHHGAHGSHDRPSDEDHMKIVSGCFFRQFLVVRLHFW